MPEQKIGSACHSFVPYMLLICRSRAIGVCNDGSSSWVGLMSPLNAGFHSDISENLQTCPRSAHRRGLIFSDWLSSSLHLWRNMHSCRFAWSTPDYRTQRCYRFEYGSGGSSQCRPFTGVPCTPRQWYSQ